MARYFGFDPVRSGKYYFISYNAQDADRVGQIALEMHKRGIPIWYDEGIEAGEDWEEEIAKKIQGCYKMIMFVTKNLMGRRDSYVKIEYNLAKQHGKKVYIVNLDQLNINDVNNAFQAWYVRLGNLQGIPVYDMDNVNDIVDTIEKKIRFSEVDFENFNNTSDTVENHTIKNTRIVENHAAKKILETEEIPVLISLRDNSHEKETAEPVSMEKSIVTSEPKLESSPAAVETYVPPAPPAPTNDSGSSAPTPLPEKATPTAASPKSLSTDKKKPTTASTKPTTESSQKKNYVPFAVGAAIIALLFLVPFIISHLPHKSNDNTSTTAENNSVTPRDITLTIATWNSEEEAVINAVMEDFKESYVAENSDVNSLTINIVDTNGDSSLNYASSADVLYANSSDLRTLVSAGLLSPAPDSRRSEIKQLFGANANFANIDATYYGYPCVAYPAQVLYYDKNVYTADDITDLNAMIKKGTIGCVDGAYYCSMWWFTAGGQLFPEGNSSLCTFDSAECTAMMEFIQSNSSQIRLYSINDSEQAFTTMKSGEISALIGALWYGDAIQDAMGDRFGVAICPNVIVNNHSYPMTCFSTVTTYAVPTSSSEPKAAWAFAAYLASEEVQIKRLELLGTLGIPTISTLASNANVQQSSAIATVAIKQMEHSVNCETSSIPGGWWDDCEQLFKNIHNGTISKNDIQSELTKYVEQWKQAAGG